MKAVLLAAALGLATPAAALAHIMLSPAAGPPGATVDIQVVVGHGCSGKPTTALTLAIPAAAGAVSVIDTAGWKFAVAQKGGKTTSVTWTAANPAAAPATATFRMRVSLPKTKGVLAFPATQVCGPDKVVWADPLVAGKPEPAHPAPSLNVGGAATAAPMGAMAGMDHAEPPAAKAAPGAPPLSVTRGWTRPAAKGQTAAGYLVIANGGGTADTLLSASSPLAGKITLHQSMLHGDMSTMAPLTSMAIAPGQTVTFGPNGYHLMIQGLKSDLKLGATLPVVLTFARAGKVSVMLKVGTGP